MYKYIKKDLCINLLHNIVHLMVKNYQKAPFEDVYELMEW